jgi:hypothetical protein
MKESEAKILEHATSIGLLCISWATLDRKLDPLIGLLLPCSKEKVASIAANIEQVGARCEILKRLVMVESPSPEWRGWFIAILDRISGEIGPLRNRCVHDYWRLKGGQMTRQDRRAKIAKPQSHEPERLIFDTTYVMPTDQVERLILRIEAALTALLAAETDLLSWRKTGQPVMPDPQLAPVSKPNARYQTDQEQAESRRRGRSPFDYVCD